MKVQNLDALLQSPSGLWNLKKRIERITPDPLLIVAGFNRQNLKKRIERYIESIRSDDTRSSRDPESQEED